MYSLFGKADKFPAKIDEPKDGKLIDKGVVKLGSQRDGYHEYILKGKMYTGKLHFRVVPVEDKDMWLTWTGYETKPTDKSSDDGLWDIEADKHKNITF